MRPRTAGRRLALQYLFMSDLNRFEGVETAGEFFAGQREAEADSGEGGGPPGRDDSRRDEAEEFAARLLAEAQGDRESLDRDIESASDNWKLSRMGAIERNILRLALAEMRMGETPPSVVIDEAVNLAKRFGDGNAGAFVNGIADRLSRAGTKNEPL